MTDDDSSTCRSSRESEGSTSDSTRQGTEPSRSASGSPTDDESSPDTGRESPASRMFVKSRRTHGEDGDRWEEGEDALTLNSMDLRHPGNPSMLAFMPHRTLQGDGTVEEGFAERPVVDALHGQTGNKEPLLVSTSSAEDSPARTSPSPDDDEGSPGSARPSSSSSPGSPMNLFGPEDGFWSRTFPDSSPAVPASDAASAGSFYDSIAEAGVSLAAMPDEVIPAYLSTLALLASSPWMAAWRTAKGTGTEESLLENVQAAARVAAATRPGAFSLPTQVRSSQWSAASSANSGFTTSPGECSIAATSECPSEGAVSSSLPDVLEADAPPRFFLSRKAGAGILRRAEKRGRELPHRLREALHDLASQTPDDDRRTTRTSSPDPSPPAANDSTATPTTSSAPSTDREEEPTTTPPKQGTSSPEPSAATSDPDRTMSEESSPTPSPPEDTTPPRTGVAEVPPLSATLKAQRGKDGGGLGPEETLVPWMAPTLSTKNEPASSGPAREAWMEASATNLGAVRRLTPTECERLQGFPDGWTWVP